MQPVDEIETQIQADGMEKGFQGKLRRPVSNLMLIIAYRSQFEWF